MCLARATPRALCGLANPRLHTGHDNDILCPITPAANSTGHNGEEHTINPVSIIDITSTPQIRTLIKVTMKVIIRETEARIQDLLVKYLKYSIIGYK